MTAADTEVHQLTTTPTLARDPMFVPQLGDALVGPGSDKCVIPVFQDSYGPLSSGGGVTDLSQWYYKASSPGVKLTVIFTLLVGMLCLLSIDAMGAASVAPAPPTTVWSRDFIRSTNANEAVAKLGIVGGGTLTVNSDHFAMSGDKLNFKSGSLITNPVFTATGLGYYMTLGPNEYGKLKFDEINVKAPPYNAKGDGTTDDTAAIQAALNTAYTGNGFSTKRGRKIYIPEGEYKITASLVLYAGTKLRGSQTESTILYGYVTNAPVIKYEDSIATQSNAHLDMEDFSLYNLAGASSGDGIYLDGTFGSPGVGGTSFNLRNIVVYNFAGNGTSSKGNMDSVWSNVKAVTCGKNGHYFSTNSFNTSSEFHLSSIGCTEFGVRGVASYSTFRGSADGNQFGGWRFDQGTAINFFGGAEFNKTNALDAKNVFGMTISGGLFLTLATNTFSAIKLDECFGVTISGIDIGGGAGGSPAAGEAPIYATKCSGVEVTGNTYWEKWNGKYIVSDGGVKEGVNYAKTTARTLYNHTFTESLWELEADSATMRLDTKTDTRTSYTWANSGTDNWSMQNARTSHELFLYNHGAGSNVVTIPYNNSAYKIHIPAVAERGIAAGTNTPQTDALHVQGNTTLNGIVTEPYGLVNAAQFGIKEGQDNRAAFQAAFDWLRNNSTPRRALYIPKGYYLVSDTIHLTNTFGAMVVGDGKYNSVIYGGKAGKPILSLIGFSGGKIEGIGIRNLWNSSEHPYGTPSSGIVLGRTENCASAGANRFEDIWVGGDYTNSMVYANSSEQNIWVNCHFDNQADVAKLGYGIPLVVLAGKAGFGQVTNGFCNNGGSGNGNNMFLHCQFNNFAPNTAANPSLAWCLIADSVQGLIVDSCYFNTQYGDRFVSFQNTASAVFEGPSFSGCRFEWLPGGTAPVGFWFHQGQYKNVRIFDQDCPPVYAANTTTNVGLWIQNVVPVGDAGGWWVNTDNLFQSTIKPSTNGIASYKQIYAGVTNRTAVSATTIAGNYYGNTDVTGALTISGAAVATESYVDAAVAAGGGGGGTVNTNVLATTNWVADRILEATNNLLMPILQTVYKTNVVSLTGDHGFINCETNAATYQFLAVAGNITLHTTNRSVRAGATPVTITLRGTNVATTVTLDTNWDNRGTNTWFTLPANKRATIQVLLYGTSETEVTAAYGIQTN